MSKEFTDEYGNPVEVNNHSIRGQRSSEDMARHEQRVNQRPQRPYTGFIPAPLVYSSLEGGMVPTGRELRQCPECGFWLSDKPSFQDEQEHERQHERR